MIQGAKKVYHSPNLDDFIPGTEMLLWTIIEKQIYLERHSDWKIDQ
jgi:hypothetical protein